MINKERFLKDISFLIGEINEPPEYNLFSTVLKEGDEVRLHSRFIASLLESTENASHGCKSDLLELFIEKINILANVNSQNKLPKEFILDTVKLTKEYKNIDILIDNENEKSCIIIENKIWAGDQENQLAKYYMKMKSEGRENIYVIYLTLDGKKPEPQSLRLKDTDFKLEDDKVICISYRDTIISWLKSCLGVIADNPPVRESVLQYIKLLNKITGLVKGNKLINAVYDRINEDTNKLKLAENISSEYLIHKDLKLEETNLLLKYESEAEIIFYAYQKYVKNNKITNDQFADKLKHEFGGKIEIVCQEENIVIKLEGSGIEVLINRIEQKHITIHYGCLRSSAENENNKELIKKALPAPEWKHDFYEGRWIVCKKNIIHFNKNSLKEIANLKEFLEELVCDIKKMISSLLEKPRKS